MYLVLKEPNKMLIDSCIFSYQIPSLTCHCKLALTIKELLSVFLSFLPNWILSKASSPINVSFVSISFISNLPLSLAVGCSLCAPDGWNRMEAVGGSGSHLSLTGCKVVGMGKPSCKERKQDCKFLEPCLRFSWQGFAGHVENSPNPVTCWQVLPPSHQRMGRAKAKRWRDSVVGLLGVKRWGRRQNYVVV